MKTELEFISGVYEKYQKEQEIRRKRVRTLSAFATLSACACVALFISVRTVPMLINSNAKTEADAAYVYTASIAADQVAEYGLYDAEFEEAADQVLFGASLAAPTAESYGLSKESVEEVQNGDSNLVKKSISPKNKANDSLNNTIAYIIGTSGEFSYILPSRLTSESVAIGVNSAVDCEITSENISDSGAVYGECREGYYVSYSGKDSLFLHIKSADTITLDEIQAIADSVTYTLQ